MELNIIDLPIYFRGAERLLVIIFAGLSVYWGYSLFSKVLPTEGELAATHGNSSLTMKRIGPGIFFAIFGAATLISSLFSKVSTSDSISAEGNRTISTMQGLGGLPDGSDINANIEGISAINTLIETSSSLPSATEREDLTAAIGKAENLRSRLIDGIYGERTFSRYSELVAKFRVNPTAKANASQTDLALIANVEQLLASR